MDVTLQGGQMQTPKGEFATDHMKMKIGFGIMPEGDKTVDCQVRGNCEAVRIDRVVGVIPNQRHRKLRINRAQDVRYEHHFSRNIDPDVRGADLLLASVANNA